MNDTGTLVPVVRGTRRLVWACIVPPAFFAALTLLLFFDVLFNSGVLPCSPYDDMALQFLPWRDFGFTQLSRGNLPLWNPYIFGGTPYLAGFQSALFYPPNWLHLVLPGPLAISWSIALHVFLAGYFTYLWCGGRGAGVCGAILGGVMFMFSGPYFLHVYAGHLPNLCVMAWVPLLLLAIEKLSSTGAIRWSLLGVPVLTMAILAGHPQYVYYTGLVMLLYTAILSISSRHRLPLAGGVLLIFVGAVLLAAVQVVTGLDAAGETTRGGAISYDYASMFAFPVENFLTLLAPGFLGSMEFTAEASSGVSYFGRWTLWETSAFVGVTGLMLAMIGAVTGRLRNLRVIVLIGLVIALALGDQLPLHRWLYDYLPGFGSFRGVSKFMFLLALLLSAMAADGFDALVTGAMTRMNEAKVPRRWWPAALALLFAFLLAVLGFVVSRSGAAADGGWWRRALVAIAVAHNEHAPESRYTDPAFIREAAGVASRAAFWASATAGVVCVLLLASMFRRRAAWGLFALALVEMLFFAWGSRGVMNPQTFYPDAWLSVVRQTPGPGDFRVVYAAQPGRREVLYVNQGMSLGIQGLGGYDPFVLRRYAQLLAASQGQSPDHVGQYRRIAGGPVGMFRMLRCRYVLSEKDDEAMVSEIPDPLPVAQLVPRFVVKESRDAVLRAVHDPTFDPLEKVVLETAPSPLPSRLAKGGPAKVVASSTDWVEIKAHTDVDCLLLVTNNFSKGWRATPLTRGPQEAYTIMPANHTLMAIPLAAGDHHLRIEYAPMAFRVGAWVTTASLVGYAACLSGWAICCARRRRRVGIAR